MTKPRPIHILRLIPGRIVASTWCLVDPYRKGVETETARNPGTATCKACLRAREEESKKTKKF